MWVNTYSPDLHWETWTTQQLGGTQTTMGATTDLVNAPQGSRPDESAVRLLFVEHSEDYAALVCQALDQAEHGHFEVRHAAQLETAINDLQGGDYDALLVDLTEDLGGDGQRTIDVAAGVAGRLPVIVLTGAADDNLGPAAAEAGDEVVREGIAKSRLPSEILRAVRRHRRLGQHAASEPIILRDPLRALARAFAKVRRTLQQAQ